MKIIKLNNPSNNPKKINKLISEKLCFIGVFSKVCIHCKNMKPEWEKLKNKLKKIKCNGLLLEIDSSYLYSMENPALSGRVNGLPTILISKNNKILKEYNGNRSTNDMLKFFKPYIIYNNSLSKKQKNNNKKIIKNNKITKKIITCKHKKNGIDGCSICCSRFKKRKTYKKCKKICMNN